MHIRLTRSCAVYPDGAIRAPHKEVVWSVQREADAGDITHACSHTHSTGGGGCSLRQEVARNGSLSIASVVVDTALCR